MTPIEIELAARQQYNAVGDTNWSQAEIMTLIYGACLDLSRKTLCIEDTFTTPTVAGQQDYTFPTNTISIKRVTYDGQRLTKISFKEDDVFTGFDQTSTNQGTPRYYILWNNTLYLRPLPDSVVNLVVYAYVEPQAVSASSVLEIPSLFHMNLVDYVLSRMYAKDKDFNSAQYFSDKWDRHVMEADKYIRKNKKGDSFGTVQDDEMLNDTLFGIG